MDPSPMKKGNKRESREAGKGEEKGENITAWMVNFQTKLLSEERKFESLRLDFPLLSYYKGRFGGVPPLWTINVPSAQGWHYWSYTPLKFFVSEGTKKVILVFHGINRTLQKRSSCSREIIWG